VAVFRNQSTWRAQVYIKGRCVASQAGFPTKAKAQAWHDETKVARKGAGKITPSTWEDLVSRLEAWHLPTVSERTREIYRLELKRRLTPYFQFMRLERIDEPMLEALKAKLMAEVGPKTGNASLDLVSLMLAKAVRWKMLAERPLAPEKIPEVKKPYRWWSERDDIQSFLGEATKSRYYALFLTALETGLRVGELLGLSKADIDYERGTIHVWRQWTPKHTYGPPKNGRERWVSFAPDGVLAEVLKCEADRSSHPEAVFTTATGRRPIRMSLRKSFLGVIKRAGVPVIKVHDLRHTFASWYMREVGDIWALKDILGHADIKTTQKYAHHARNQRLPALSLAARVTHSPHTAGESRVVNGRNERGKEWWGYTDSKRVSASFAA
jgi:integrase